MKYFGTGFFLTLLSLISCSQPNEEEIKIANHTNTVLWKISGNGLKKPSYIYGTIHMICKEDALLSKNLEIAISGSDGVYLEVDMDDMAQMLGMMSSLKMQGDTTLKDLLNEEDYELVKDYFTKNSSMLPFSMVQTYKPILAASTLIEKSSSCSPTTSMEQEIMAYAQKKEKEILGLETMQEQAGFLDQIPYKEQAAQLVEYIKNENNASSSAMNNAFEEMMKAYKAQNLDSLEILMVREDMGMANFTDLLLYTRNEKWVGLLKDILPNGSYVFAVGAGHLPGERGVLQLLKKAGYSVEPVENKGRKLVEI